jgi:hypothetical protein
MADNLFDGRPGHGLGDRIGRLGAILAPILAGELVDGGLQAARLYYLYAVPMVIAILTVRGLPVK